jgi:hypothetical protein
MLIPCQEEQDVIIRFSLIQVIAFQLTLAPLVPAGAPRHEHQRIPSQLAIPLTLTGMSRYRRSRTHRAQRDVHRASRTRVSPSLGTTVVIFLLIKNFLCSQARKRDLDQIQLSDLDPKVCH